MIEERTGECLPQVEHIRGHLWHRYSIYLLSCFLSAFLTTTASCFNNSSCACSCSTRALINWLLTMAGISIFANWKYLTSTFNPLSSWVQMSIQSEHTANIRIMHYLLLWMTRIITLYTRGQSNFLLSKCEFRLESRTRK